MKGGWLENTAPYHGELSGNWGGLAGWGVAGLGVCGVRGVWGALGPRENRIIPFGIGGGLTLVQTKQKSTQQPDSNYVTYPFRNKGRFENLRAGQNKGWCSDLPAEGRSRRSYRPRW